MSFLASIVLVFGMSFVLRLGFLVGVWCTSGIQKLARNMMQLQASHCHALRVQSLSSYVGACLLRLSGVTP